MSTLMSMDSWSLHRRSQSRSLLVLKMLAVVSLIVVGTYVMGSVLLDPTGNNVAALASMAAVGMLSGAASLRLSLAERHGWAAVAALMSIVTPTGFAYLPNLAMLAFAVDEVRLHRAR